LDSNRINDWKRAGLITEFDNSIQSYNAIDLGATNDGVFDNAWIVNDVIADLDSGSTLYFPAGFYFFKSSLKLKSNVSIAGDLGKTYFVFDSMATAHGMVLQGKWAAGTQEIAKNASSKQTFLIIAGANFKLGDILYVGDMDSFHVFSNWAVNSTGQFIEVKKVSNDTVYLNNELRRDYLLSRYASVRRANPIRNVSISNLILIRKDSTVAQTSNVQLDMAYNCELHCVESYTANFAHVAISNSLNVSINGCYFKDANGYGSGGRGYGVALQFASSECKLYNNVFEHLRHSILLQAGANGNFIGYNYSSNPYWTQTSLPSDAAGDIVLHGNYVYANLFEGNEVQNIVIDDSHGINGPNNVFLRNRAGGYGVFMNPQIATDSQLFIGNEITNTAFPKGLYSLAGKGHFEFGNNVAGNCLPTNTQNVSLNSLYFNEIPAEYKSLNVWPLIGYPTVYASTLNLAHTRDLQAVKTNCGELPGSVFEFEVEQIQMLFPNPAKSFFSVKKGALVSEIIIVNTVGEEVACFQSAAEHYSIALPAGIYWVKIFQGNTTSAHKLVVI
jgi:hypothetical protein